MIERWKDIKGYEGLYTISNFGRVKSLFRWIVKSNNHTSPIPEKILKPFPTRTGYLLVALTKDKVLKCYSVHRLLMKSFHGESNLNVDHINGIRDDNRLSNLRYCTPRENTIYWTQKLNKFTGSYFDKRTQKWQSGIRINGKKKHLGRFDTAQEAHDRYKEELNKIKLWQHV